MSDALKFFGGLFVVALIATPFVLAYAVYGWVRHDLLASPPADGYYAVERVVPNTNVYIDGIAVDNRAEQARIFFRYVDPDGSDMTPAEVVCADSPDVGRHGRMLVVASPRFSHARDRDMPAERNEYEQYTPTSSECDGSEGRSIRTDAMEPVNLWGGFELRREFGKPFMIRIPSLAPGNPATTDLLVDLSGP